MRSIVLLCSGLLALSSCRNRTGDDAAVTAAAADAGHGALAEHGGMLAFAANLRAEVLAQPDGRVMAYLTSPQGVPVQAESVKVGLRKPDGQVQSVPVSYDPVTRAYVGRAAGVPPGAYPVQVEVQQAPTAPPVMMLTAPVTLAQTVQPPAPQHGGQVMVLGDKAVEVVVARSGDVATFWTTLAGAPIDPGQVVAPTLVVKVDDRPQTVMLRPSGGALIGHVDVDVGTRAALDISLPTVSLGGAVYFGAEVPRVPVVVSIPGNLFAVPAARPVAPTVVIAQPTAPPPQAMPNVAIARPTVQAQVQVQVQAQAAPNTVVIARPAAPTVVIARPAPPPVVVVQQGGEGRGRNGRGRGDDDDRGRGRGNDDDRGRGRGRGDDNDNGNRGRARGHDESGRGHGRNR
ncbi:MAG: hypothetical protein Q8S73_23605 [Deltaproteobacteria bacterium]|nr:hypothetical protein [Myxococcales bacterium]MDP3217117.1 hypothetical protein [Deltaproteobacteria bacterium]